MGLINKSLTKNPLPEPHLFKTHFDARAYFAHPYCAWERATNENTNGLLRQFLPKKTDFRSLTQAQLDIIAHRLN